MRITILIFLFLFTKPLHSAPEGVISQLMDKKVSAFTYGMHRCYDRLEDKKNGIDWELAKLSTNRDLEVGFNNCYYNWEKNQIQLIYHIYERTSSTTQDPAPELSNQLCSEILLKIRKEYVINLGDNVWNLIVQQFVNEGFNLSIDKEIDKSLKDYLYLYVGTVRGHKCKSKLDLDAEILYYQ